MEFITPMKLEPENYIYIIYVCGFFPERVYIYIYVCVCVFFSFSPPVVYLNLEGSMRSLQGVSPA